MNRYRIVFAYIFPRTGEAYYRIDKLENGQNNWKPISDSRWLSHVAIEMLESIVATEREVILVPMSVTTIKFS